VRYPGVADLFSMKRYERSRPHDILLPAIC
jgi:hypothetical protein